MSPLRTTPGIHSHHENELRAPKRKRKPKRNTERNREREGEVEVRRQNTEDDREKKWRNKEGRHVLSAVSSIISVCHLSAGREGVALPSEAVEVVRTAIRTVLHLPTFRQAGAGRSWRLLRATRGLLHATRGLCTPRGHFSTRLLRSARRRSGS